MSTRSQLAYPSTRRRGQSLYRSVADAIRRRVAEGELPVGGKVPSLRVLARAFNVSTMTVNQALRMLHEDGIITYIPSVGAFVRDARRVHGAAAPMTVAFVTIEIESTFTSRLATGIVAACRERRWALQIANAEAVPEIEAQNIAQLPESGVSGAILQLTSDHANFEAVFQLKLSGFPFVLVDRWIQGLRVDVVESNHEQGAWAATRHLLTNGHNRVYMLSCAPGLISSVDARWQGYERALLEWGIEPRREWRVICDPQAPDHQPRWTRWFDTAVAALDRLEKPCAFVTLNAYAGRGLLEACRHLGLRVPDDVSVVSFDDSEFMQAFHPPITVIAQRAHDLGRLALEQLERRIEAGPQAEPRHILVDMDLIERQSVRRLDHRS